MVEPIFPNHGALRKMNILHPIRVNRLVSLMLASLLIPSVRADAAPQAPKPAMPELLRTMEGNWTVTQRMWPGAGQQAVDLLPAIAQRRIIQNSFLNEVMESVGGSTQDAFNRTSYIDFNTTSHQFEYFSLDSRLPQMMNERSEGGDSSLPADGWIKLGGRHFIAPTWGKSQNVPFHYRLAIGGVNNDRQVVRLYLTPESGADRKEFLAFEYIYTRAI
jgi:hypothetical protein